MIEQVLDDIKNMLSFKGEEYVGASQDRYRNFNQAADLQHESKQQALLGFVSKQIVSLLDAKHVNPDRLTDPTFIDEKAGDIAVYMILLMAMTRTDFILNENKDIL